jgi:DNA-binding NtrC family response regulator
VDNPDDTVTRSALHRVGGDLELRCRRPVLRIQEADGSERELVLRDGPTVLGRGEEADVRLRDGSVSRLHARVRPEGRAWVIEDLDSRAGVRVDGVPVREAVLTEGARVELGDTTVTLLGKESRERIARHPGGEMRGLVGASEAMKECFGLVTRLADLELPIVLHGETGTGKEGLARALHDLGPRRDRPFVTVDCTLMHEEHLRSELFGHVAGAFTGADQDREGALARAHRGTLFLDEVGDLDLQLQPALLRALQEGEVRPLGSDRVRQVDVRVVAASHRDLCEEVRAGRFRADLYYRLAGVEVEVPPLRARGEDVLVLARHFLPERRRLSKEAEERLLESTWPGNVRQLENVVRAAGAMASGEEIQIADLGDLDLPPPAEVEVGPELASALQHAEADKIREVLREAGGNRTRAAELLGISPATLYRRLRKYRIG